MSKRGLFARFARFARSARSENSVNFVVVADSESSFADSGLTRVAFEVSSSSTNCGFAGCAPAVESSIALVKRAVVEVVLHNSCCWRKISFDWRSWQRLGFDSDFECFGINSGFGSFVGVGAVGCLSCC